MKSFRFALSEEGVFLREVVLLQKVYGAVSLERIEKILRESCKGLRIELTCLSGVENEWINVKVFGEDEEVAVRFLGKKVGLAPISIENIKRLSVLCGRVILSGRSKIGIFVDVGVFSPEPVYATIPLQRLQGQLVDGRKFTLGRIAELYGLVDKLPLEIRIVKVGAGEFKAELTEKQLELYSRWIATRTDRLVVLGALGHKVIEAIRRMRLERDVLGVESLGILEHVVVCKLGTDAVGLVPKLGRWLSKASFVRFSPRQVLKLTGKALM